MPYSAFVSHSSKDDTFVKALRQALDIYGIPVWADSRELLAGDILEKEIQEAITTAENFFIVVSSNTFQSKWVKKELDHAKSLGKRMIALLLDGQTVGVFAWLFDEEPIAISVSTQAGGLQNAMAEILVALGKRLPDDPQPVFQAPEAPLNELILTLEDPALYTEGGVQRGSARARLEFQPADGSEKVESGTFTFISPLGPDVAERIRWYIEDFPQFAFLEKYLPRAEEVAAKLPGWGQALLDTICVGKNAAEVFRSWFDNPGKVERRFSVKLDATTPPARADEAATADFYKAASLLLGTPWEMLHDGKGFLFQGQRPVRVRRMQPNREKKDPMPLHDRLRILLLSPRPEDKHAGLIDHRAAARALVHAVNQLGDLVELHILDTPTFPALARTIRQAAELGKPFSVVHFDGHGVFDQHKGLGALCFESHEAAEQAKLEGRATDIVYTDQLAAELNKLRIPFFFLDACQSAQAEKDPMASVAATLLENGVGSVAAMSHSVLVTTAERFTTAFYSKLAQGALIGTAMLEGQQALHADAVRFDLPDGEKLRLQDWFVPVLFQEKKDPQLVRSVPGARLREFLGKKRETALGNTPPAPPHGFVGRNRELLALERLLLRERFAVLQGQGGAGKTTLATELARWLLDTQRFDRLAFVSFEKLSDTRSALDAIGKQLDGDGFSIATYKDEEEAHLVIDRRLREYPTLILLDNLESMLPDAEGNSPLGVEPVENFTAFFSRLLAADPRTRLLLTTRERLPAPFDAGKNYRRTRQLAPADALRLIAEVMKNEGIPVPSLNVEDLEKEFGALARNANYHARALILLAKTLAERGGNMPALNADLSHLMADLDKKHPGERENSLFASIELSLRRLPPQMREVVDALAVFHGGADLIGWANVAQREPQEVAQAGMALVAVGLAELALDKYPYYFKTDPALPTYLRSRSDAASLEAMQERWLEGMLTLNGFLYQQQNKDTDLCRLTEANLLAMLAALEKTGGPEQIVKVAAEVEKLFSTLGRRQVMLFAQRLREKAASGMREWSHPRFVHQCAAIDRFWEQGNLNAAFQLAKETLASCERAGETAYPEAAQDLARANYKLGDVLIAGGRAEQALPFLKEARQRYEDLTMEYGESAVRMASSCLSTIGRCFIETGAYGEAARYYQKAIELGRKRGDFQDVFNDKVQLATVRMLQKDYPEALRLYAQAKVFFEHNHEPASVATILHQIGIVNNQTGNYPAAEKAYLESLAIRIREKIRQEEATSLAQLGNLYNEMGRLEDALRMKERAATIYSELGNLRYEGTARNNLANTLLKLNRPIEARTQLLRAIECNSHFGHAAEPWATWFILCKLEIAEGNHPAAAAARQKAMQTYAAYRKDGGDSRSSCFQLISATVQALQAGQAESLLLGFEALLKEDHPIFVKALLRRFNAMLRGEVLGRPAEDMELEFMDAVELELAFGGGG